jgi:hypothetical protein
MDNQPLLVPRMKIEEVIQKANAFVLANTGVLCDPDSVHLVRSRDEPWTWRLLYHFSYFYPDIARSGGVVDGGEYIVVTNDQTGEMSHFYV